jgi:hypothetical protein
MSGLPGPQRELLPGFVIKRTRHRTDARPNVQEARRVATRGAGDPVLTLCLARRPAEPAGSPYHATHIALAV